jgi:nucleoside-diphosphate kinase
MRRTPVIMLLLERENAVAELRKLCGPTDSNEARKVAPGSIRAKFGRDKSENIIHASDSPEAALAETNRFFDKQEIARKGGIPLSELEILIKALYR